MKKDALYLLDGYSLIYRSYFAFINRPLLNPQGQNVSAYFGFFRSLLNLFDAYNPGYFAVVMDSRVPTFRHEMYPDYKATRDKAPEDLHAQVPMIEETLEAMNIRTVQQDRYEADDIIATLARRCSRDGRPCYIVSGDKDLLQLLDANVQMLRPDKGSYRRIGLREVQEELGIKADQVIDYLSLIGDSADNIPGVRGIGPKTASKLLKKYGSLDGIYEHLDECSSGEQSKLKDGRDSAYMSRDLVVLHTVEQTSCEMDEYSLEALDREAAIPLFLREGAKGLAEQAKGSGLDERQMQELLESKSGQTGDEQRSGDVEAKGRSDASAPAAHPGNGKGSYTTVTSIDELDRWIARVEKSGWFAFDCETTSLDEMKARPVGFSISVVSGEACYIPIEAGGQIRLPEDEVRPRLKKILTNPDLKLIGHNFKYDYKVLACWGIRTANLVFDTMIAAWLLDSTASTYGMDGLAETCLGYRTVHYDEVVPKGELFTAVDLHAATEYAAEDADITFRLFEYFKDRIESEGLSELFYQTEMPLVRVLAEMELRGIRLLSERLDSYSEELDRELAQIERSIYDEVGYEFNISSTKQLQEVLFVERKLKPVKKTKTGYSTDINVLEQLSEEDIVPQMVVKHRGLSKLKSTYVDTLPKLVNADTGRIHTRFLQTGTATGRLSSRDPNLQNIPIRDEAGRRIRKAFVPREDWTLISADYSQIELVVLAHLSGDPVLSETFRKGGDVHSRTAALIFETAPDQVSSEQRRIAKTINFGVMYGMSGFRLSNELKIPRAKADQFIGAYFQRYAGISRFIEKTIAETEKKGYVTTMLGHRRNIPGITSRNRMEKSGAERIAVNTPIQGTAADIVKLAMLKLDSLINAKDLPLRMLLQIHDELIFEAPADRAEELSKFITETMESAVELSVPLKVSVENGQSWGELH
ncbi:MAG: DNA polymerase I [Sediminispirochaetaceae bacterium]